MNAQTRYNELTTEIEAQIAKLQAALKSHKEEFQSDSRNWGFVGDLGMVKEELNTLQGFMNSTGVTQ